MCFKKVTKCLYHANIFIISVMRQVETSPLPMKRKILRLTIPAGTYGFKR